MRVEEETEIKNTRQLLSFLERQFRKPKKSKLLKQKIVSRYQTREFQEAELSGYQKVIDRQESTSQETPVSVYEREALAEVLKEVPLGLTKGSQGRGR